MKPLKKILFLVLFTIAITNVMGITVSTFQKNLFIIENNESSKQTCSSIVSSESENNEDEVKINNFFIFIGIPIIGQIIYSGNCLFISIYNNSCWQPPKNS
jgi:hypothetical protein